MPDELPISHCWRCGAVCDTEWIDVHALGETEPSFVKGRSPCSNERCVGRFDACADSPPSPEELRARGDAVMERILDAPKFNPQSPKPGLMISIAGLRRRFGYRG